MLLLLLGTTSFEHKVASQRVAMASDEDSLFWCCGLGETQRKTWNTAFEVASGNEGKRHCFFFGFLLRLQEWKLCSVSLWQWLRYKVDPRDGKAWWNWSGWKEYGYHYLVFMLLVQIIAKRVCAVRVEGIEWRMREIFNYVRLFSWSICSIPQGSKCYN